MVAVTIPCQMKLISGLFPICLLAIFPPKVTSFTANHGNPAQQQSRERAVRLPRTHTCVSSLSLLSSGFEDTAKQLVCQDQTNSQLLLGFLAAIASKEIWQALPDWKRQQMIPPVRDRIRKYVMGEDPDDDFVSVSAIARKLQIIFGKIRSRIDRASQDDDDAIVDSIKNNSDGVISLLDLIALIKLLDTIRHERAPERDARYTTEEYEQVEDPSQLPVMQGLDELFDFASWGYESDNVKLRENLNQHGFTLLRHDKVDLPGSVDHYIAISKERKEALICIKGSTSFEDLLTDCCMQARYYQLTGPFVEGGPDEIRAHEGISLAARRLADDVETMAAELLLPSDYKLVITGHSLGGSVAAVLGMVLRSRLGSQYPALLTDDGSMIQVFAFASPPVLDYHTALACAPFTTSIINNSDIIPRTSLANLSVLLEYMKVVNRKLKERGMSPDTPLGLINYMRMLVQKRIQPQTKNATDKPNSNFLAPIMTIEEIRTAMADAYDKVDLLDPDHLYVPGKVVHMYDLWSKEDYGKRRSPKTAPASRNNPDSVAGVNGETLILDDGEVLSNDNTQKARSRSTISDPVTASPVEYLRTAERIHIADGTSDVLRYIEIDERMVSDHLVPSYRNSIRDLLHNLSSSHQAEAANGNTTEEVVTSAL